MTMKWPLVVKSPGSMLAMIISPSRRRARISSSLVEVASPRRPKAAAPVSNSVQAVPAPET